MTWKTADCVDLSGKHQQAGLNWNSCCQSQDSSRWMSDLLGFFVPFFMEYTKLIYPSCTKIEALQLMHYDHCQLHQSPHASISGILLAFFLAALCHQVLEGFPWDTALHDCWDWAVQCQSVDCPYACASTECVNSRLDQYLLNSWRVCRQWMLCRMGLVRLLFDWCYNCAEQIFCSLTVRSTWPYSHMDNLPLPPNITQPS